MIAAQKAMMKERTAAPCTASFSQAMAYQRSENPPQTFDRIAAVEGIDHQRHDRRIKQHEGHDRRSS